MKTCANCKDKKPLKKQAKKLSKIVNHKETRKATSHPILSKKKPLTSLTAEISTLYI